VWRKRRPIGHNDRGGRRRELLVVDHQLYGLDDIEL
jgi:hypothetical protein